MGVAKMTKEGVTLTINDRQVVVTPFTWKELGKFESFIKSQRIAELHEALELTKPVYPKDMLNITAYPPDAEIPPDVIKYHEWQDFKSMETQKILKTNITAEDLAVAENSFTGKLYIVRLGLRDNADVDAIMEEVCSMENGEESKANLDLIQQMMEPGGRDENPPSAEPEILPAEPETQPQEPQESESA